MLLRRRSRPGDRPARKPSKRSAWHQDRHAGRYSSSTGGIACGPRIRRKPRQRLRVPRAAVIFDDRAFGAFLESLPPEVLVVVDEAYAEFSDHKQFPRSMSYIGRHPVLVMRTFSKAYGLAGLRVGYGMAEESLVSFLERTKQPFSVNMMALIAARAFSATNATLPPFWRIPVKEKNTCTIP